MPASIESMPKIELHCHLDGSLDLLESQKILSDRGENYELTQLKDLMQVNDDCQNLLEYLQRFSLPNHCLQDIEGIKKSAYYLARNAAAENVKYLEVRYAPTSSMSQGLSINDTIEAVELGLKKAREDFDIETGIILCMMRGLDDAINLSVAKAGMEMLDSGVVACDIAGDEAGYPMSQHIDIFNSIKKMGMPFTIHVGETGNLKNVKDAIEVGTHRLGHGIAMSKDEELMRYCGRKKIGVELCPTSNLQTKAYTTIQECPICTFMNYGIPVSLNTDNRTVSNTTCSKEYVKICNAFNMDEEQLHQIYINSVEMSFASDDIKHSLLKKWR